MHEISSEVIKKLQDLHPESGPLPPDLLAKVPEQQWNSLNQEEEDIDLVRAVFQGFSDASAV